MFGRVVYGGVGYSAWCEAPPKIGGCSRCARPAGTLAAEKNVLAGGAGQNMIASFSAGCGRRNSARRALPGESVGRKVLDILKEGFLLPKPSPRGEGAPVRALGRMRGRSTHPTGQEKEAGKATGPSFYKVRLGTESPPHQSPSVTASPRGEAFVGGMTPQRKAFSPNPCSRKMRIQIRARRWAPY